MSLLLRGGLVVTQDAGRRIVRGDVLVEKGRVVAVGSVPGGADEEIDCGNCAVIPGLINAHNHVANTLLRGIADDVPLEAMLEKSFAADAKLTRRDVQVGALLGCLEMLRGGTTSFVDLFYWEDEVARAVRESGIRGFLAWVTLDEAFTTQRGNPVRNAEAFVRKHRGLARVHPWVGVQGVYACSEETWLAAKEVADREDVRLHGHLAETRPEVYNHQAKHGLRPAEWLESIGFLSERFLAAHAVWLTLSEVRTLARRGVSVAHCPVSNMKLASGGVAPVPEMLEAGVPVGLGTDSPISNNGMDLLADLKLAALLHKSSRWDARVLPAQAALDMVTVEAARAVGMTGSLGSIEPGKIADLAVVDLGSPNLTPTTEANLVSNLVYAARSGDVRDVVVDGRAVLRGRRFPGLDEAQVVARAAEASREALEL